MSVGDLLKYLGFNPFIVIVIKNCEVVGERNLITNKDVVTISKLGCC
jgi:sulfur carrier protein ThiS